MKASSTYTVEQLRDPVFTKKYGVEASIMDYGRFNYVAQPGDGARLIPIIGPYDEFAIEWGYREFPDAKTYEQEKKELDKIAARQLEDPKLRFGDPNPREDPSQQTEDLGSDPIRATELGLKNIDRVAGYLVKATAKAGENYDLLRDDRTTSSSTSGTASSATSPTSSAASSAITSGTLRGRRSSRRSRSSSRRRRCSSSTSTPSARQLH